MACSDLNQVKPTFHLIKVSYFTSMHEEQKVFFDPFIKEFLQASDDDWCFCWIRSSDGNVYEQF